VITSTDLTTAERQTLEQRSDGYHDDAKFWAGFADFQNHPNCNRWGNGSTDEAFVRGWEAAMRVTIKRKPVLNDYDRDDLESLLQIATLRGVAEQRQQGRAKIVGLVKTRAWDLAARQVRPGNA